MHSKHCYFITNVKIILVLLYLIATYILRLQKNWCPHHVKFLGPPLLTGINSNIRHGNRALLHPNHCNITNYIITHTRRGPRRWLGGLCPGPALHKCTTISNLETISVYPKYILGTLSLYGIPTAPRMRFLMIHVSVSILLEGLFMAKED